MGRVGSRVLRLNGNGEVIRDGTTVIRFEMKPYTQHHVWSVLSQ